MNQVPYRHLHKIYLTLDIKRADGRDVREFASKLNIPVPEFERLQREAEIQRTTTTSVILAQQVPSSWTVGDFVKIMTEMERADIIELINEWEWERDRFYRLCILQGVSIDVSTDISVECRSTYRPQYVSWELVEISAEWRFPVGEYQSTDWLTVGRDSIGSDCQQCIGESSVEYW